MVLTVMCVCGLKRALETDCVLIASPLCRARVVADGIFGRYGLSEVACICLKFIALL